jgi:4-hydroxybenzoate polyprenyltransferase
VNGPERQTCAVAPGGPLRPWLELVRAPNLLTALADAAAGFLFTHPALARQDLPWFALLATASVLLYAGGVVLNDVFDCETDRRERPQRPLPSGRVSIRAAERLGWSLLAGGLALGWAVAAGTAELRPALVATGLAAMIVAYDRVIKRTPLGPVAMGACRSLNLLLGMSTAAGPWGAEHALIAVAIGLYVTGVTWFARTEASSSRQGQLMVAAVVVLAGIALLEPLPRWTADPVVALLRAEPIRWLLLLATVAGLVGIRLLRAIVDPSPHFVQAAVRHCIFSLIVLDAAIAFVTQGLLPAATVILLLVPATILARFAAST